MCMCVGIYTSAGAPGAQKAELELQVAVSFQHVCWELDSSPLNFGSTFPV